MGKFTERPLHLPNLRVYINGQRIQHTLAPRTIMKELQAIHTSQSSSMGIPVGCIQLRLSRPVWYSIVSYMYVNHQV